MTDDPHQLIERAVAATDIVGPTKTISATLHAALVGSADDWEPGHQERLARDILNIAEAIAEVNRAAPNDAGWDMYQVPTMVMATVHAAGAGQAENIVEHGIRTAIDGASSEIDGNGSRLTFSHRGNDFDMLVTSVTPVASGRIRIESREPASAPGAVPIEGHAEQEPSGGQPDRQ